MFCDMSKESLVLHPFSRPLANASVQLPGSKSISNRALLLAAISGSEVVLDGLLRSEDTELMLQCLADLGIPWEEVSSTRIRVKGQGAQFPKKEAVLYVGTAGTVARLLIGVLGVQKEGCFRIDGSEVMRNRPMKGLTDLLGQVGCEFEFLGEPDSLPFVMRPHGFQAKELEVDASASSQVLSAVFMAAGLAGHEVLVRLSSDTIRRPYVIMTYRMMQSFGGPEITWNDSFTKFVIKPGHGYQLNQDVYAIESDASAASYFLALPVATGGCLDVFNFDAEGLQGDVAFAEVLQQIGFQVEKLGSGVRVSFTDKMVDELTHDFYPISDTFMTLAAMAPILPFPVRIEGIAHTRKQESDRVSATVNELRKLGQQVEEGDDFLHVIPDRDALVEVARKGISIETYKDHRIAMSFAVLGCCDILETGEPWMTIIDPACCEKTFPEFFDVLERLRNV